MQPGYELDNTVKNVVQELMRECTNRKIPISYEFVVYYVKLLLLNPAWDIVIGELPSRNDVQKFVKHCLVKLENPSSPSIVTLKMQLIFKKHFHGTEAAIDKRRAYLKESLAPLEQDVIETRSYNKQDITKLNTKIIYLVTLYSGLGNPTRKTVYREAAAALRSVFLENDLQDFMMQTTETKQLQIVELAELVTGIRLFNRKYNNGGAGIENVPRIVKQAIDSTKASIQRTLVKIMNHVNLLTTAIDNCYEIEEDVDGYSLMLKLPNNVKEQDIKLIKDTLVVYREYELFVRKILVEVSKLEKAAKVKSENLNETYNMVNETLKFKIFVPAADVFPLFLHIGQIWCDLQNILIVLSHLNRLLRNLKIAMRVLTKQDNTAADVLIEPDGPITDAERLEQTNELTIPPLQSDAILLTPNDIQDFDKVQLQYLGFCAWKFVETGGGLIPGDSNMGVIKFQDMYFIFSCPEAAVAFDTDPSRYLLRGLEVARNNVDLVNLLDLHEQLVKVQNIGELIVKVPEIIENEDVDIQTDLHPVVNKYDHDYKWNVWDWRRLAILLANISKCQTHSMQTIRSGGWNAIKIQKNLSKEVSCQTKTDNYSNVPTVSNFIYGLRGRKDNIQHIITLTRPVHE